MTYVEQELANASWAVEELTNKVNELTEKLEKAHRRLNTFRLMVDIKDKRIIPVIAETGTVADVTFS